MNANIPKIRNIKYHFRVEPISFPNHLLDRAKIHNNFIVLKISEDGYKFVYIIFSKSGFVNVTGIRGFHELKPSLSLFTKYFGYVVPYQKIVIDNIVSSGSLNLKSSRCARLKLEDIKTKLKEDKNYFISLNVHYFPGLIIRHKFKKHGTIILFSTGSYIIQGCKNVKSTYKTYKILLHHVRSHDERVS